MAEYQTKNLKLALSQAVEPTYNSMLSATADVYLGMLTTGRAFYVPDKEKFDDTGKIGTGQPYPTEQRSGYIVVPTIELTDELNVENAAILARRAMGAPTTYTPTQVGTTGVYDHAFTLQDTNVTRQLPSSTVLTRMGSADYLWGGVVVDGFRVDQTRSDVPTFTATMVGSGKNIKVSTLGSPPTFPLPVKQNYMVGAETYCEFTYDLDGDGAGVPVTVVLTNTSAQRLLAFTFGLANNIKTDDRRPGDPRAGSTPKQGHYINRANVTDPTITSEMTIMMDENLNELLLANEDIPVTNFIYRARGQQVGTSGTNQNEFEIKLPKCYFRAITPEDDAGDAVLRVGIFCVFDGTSSVFQLRVRSTRSTVIV